MGLGWEVKYPLENSYYLSGKENLPFFSVIIPTYGRPVRLGSCLSAVSAFNYPRECFEVIVVDDGSETPLMSVCEPFREKIELTLVSQTHKGPAAARNKGAGFAKGDYLVFTDDDCMPSKDLLSSTSKYSSDHGDCAVAGRMINVLTDNPYSVASQVLIDYLYKYYSSKPNRLRFYTTSMLAVPAEGFRKLGGFDESFPRAAAEDRDFCSRWFSSGRKIIFDPEIIIFHAHALSLRGFIRQHFDYGRGALHYYNKCKSRGQRSVRIEGVSFYTGLIRHPFLSSHVKSRAFISLLLMVSQVANAFGFFREKFMAKVGSPAA